MSLLAKKVIVELNGYHNPRVSEMADIALLGAPPRRNKVTFSHPLEKIGDVFVRIDPSKVVGIVDSPTLRAECIIENCVHPMYRDYMRRYLESAAKGHIHHNLRKAFELHINFMERGTMLPD